MITLEYGTSVACIDKEQEVCTSAEGHVPRFTTHGDDNSAILPDQTCSHMFCLPRDELVQEKTPFQGQQQATDA